jgi:hypothetical protein
MSLMEQSAPVPTFIPKITANLERVGLLTETDSCWRRLVIEKPFTMQRRRRDGKSTGTGTGVLPPWTARGRAVRQFGCRVHSYPSEQ